MKKFTILILLTVLSFVSHAEQYTCVASSLNIRAIPAQEGKIIGSLKRNKVVEVVAIENGWAKIKFNGKKGYVSAKFLTKGKVKKRSQTSALSPKTNLIANIKWLYGLGFKDWEFYVIAIVGLFIAVVARYISIIDELLLQIDTDDNNIPTLAIIWGMLFGALTSLWEERVFGYIGNFSYSPSGNGFAVWVLWLFGMLILIFFAALCLKSIFRFKFKGLIRIISTVFFSTVSIIVFAMLAHMFVDWVKGVIGTIILIWIAWVVIFGEKSASPDFVIKGSDGTVFHGWFRK